jgi:hypothetical protein
MGVKHGRPRAGQGLEPGVAAGSKSVTNALREEAERDWAESDRKTAKGLRRRQAGAKRRREASERDAEIRRLKGKLDQTKRGRGRKAK